MATKYKHALVIQPLWMVLPTLLLFAAWPVAAQGGTFTRLNQRDINVTGISADGKIVVGAISNSGPVFRWTAETGVVAIGGSGFRAIVSRDGKTIVSNASDLKRLSQAAIWQGGTNWTLLGGVPGGEAQRDATTGGTIISSAWGVSGDGAVIVGLAFLPDAAAHGFRWDAQHGMVDLGSLSGRDSRATAVSGDGNVIVGFDTDLYQSFGSPFRGSIWWQGTERLLHAFGWVGEAMACNTQGSIIVGKGSLANVNHAYVYTSWDGKVEDLGAIQRGFLPGVQDREDASRALAVSDTMVVVGHSGFKPPLDAFIWTPDQKMLKLSTYLTSLGVKGLDGWVLFEADAITPDGKGIAGIGMDAQGVTDGWVVNLK